MNARIGLRTGLLAATVLVSLGLATSSDAVPRYSARYEQNCGLCHVNPTGGGQRTLYAAQYLIPAEIAARSAKPEELERIDPRIGKNLSIGTDLRTIFHAADEDRNEIENFIQMEGSIYLAFELSERFTAQVGRGMFGSTEVYGTGYLLPYHGYLKVGRFVPDLGWRFADHTLFVRQKPWSASGGVDDLGGRPANLTDVGIEAGIFPGRGAITVGLVNGNGGGTADTDGQLAVAARALYRGRLGPVGLALGGSYWRNPEGEDERNAGGPFGYLMWGPLTWMAELDWSHGPDPEAEGKVTHLTSSQQLAVLISRGFELLATMDLHDPDIDLQSGAAARYTAGLHYTPYPFLAVSGAFEAYRYDQGALVEEQDFNQVQAQVHFFY